MVPVFRPQNGVELAIAESVLCAHEIPYFVHNNGFGALYPGMQIDLYNQRTIMVPASAFDDARELLHQFLIVDAGFIGEDMMSDKANVWEKRRKRL
jgi:hypothetical protein